MDVPLGAWTQTARWPRCRPGYGRALGRRRRPPQRGRRSRHRVPLAARQRPPRVCPPRGGARTCPEASAARRPRRGRCGLRHGHAPERQRRPPQQDSSPGRWRVLVPRRHEGLLAALLGNIRRVSALLKEARGHVWRHQPRAIRAKAGAGAATGALRDSAAGLLGTDEARDPDDGASSLCDAVRGRGTTTSGADEDATRTNGACQAPCRYGGEGTDGGRRRTGGRRAGGLRQTVNCRNK